MIDRTIDARSEKEVGRMLVLLKVFGWFMLSFMLCTIIIFVAYYVFMSYGGYRWSIRSAISYLSEHGRGNFPDENQYITGIDVMTRLIWVFVFAIVTGILGVFLLWNWPLRAGLIVAEICFMFLMVHIELCFIIQIGRLESIDRHSRTAYFTDIGSNQVFTYQYGEDSEALLKEKKKYLVADYGIFAMFAGVDEFEWG